MRFNNLIIFVLSLAIVTAAVSCDQEMVEVNLTTSSWKVDKIQRNGSTIYEEADSIYIIRFKNDSTLSVRLDANQCFGKFYIEQEGKIEIIGMACTKVCCDSEYAEALIQILWNVSEYKVKGEELNLYGDGNVVLKGVIHEACYDTPPANEACAAYFERWFYDDKTSLCKKIGYSGCSEYGFETQEECEDCKGI